LGSFSRKVETKATLFLIFVVCCARELNMIWGTNINTLVLTTVYNSIFLPCAITAIDGINKRSKLGRIDSLQQQKFSYIMMLYVANYGSYGHCQSRKIHSVHLCADGLYYHAHESKQTYEAIQ
jgi:hypothetical protein